MSLFSLTYERNAIRLVIGVARPAGARSAGAWASSAGAVGWSQPATAARRVRAKGRRRIVGSREQAPVLGFGFRVRSTGNSLPAVVTAESPSYHGRQQAGGKGLGRAAGRQLTGGDRTNPDVPVRYQVPHGPAGRCARTAHDRTGAPWRTCCVGPGLPSRAPMGRRSQPTRLPDTPPWSAIGAMGVRSAWNLRSDPERG